VPDRRMVRQMNPAGQEWIRRHNPARRRALFRWIKSLSWLIKYQVWVIGSQSSLANIVVPGVPGMLDSDLNPDRSRCTGNTRLSVLEEVMAKQVFRQTLRVTLLLSVAFAIAIGSSALSAGQKAKPGAAQSAPVIKLDEDYAKRILDNTPDKRILTELVDHMPVSATVPSPLKFLGYVPGENNRLTYHKDIVAYYEALDKASDRVTMWEIGKTEENRSMVALAIADEATIKSLDKYKQITAQLTDPRKLTEPRRGSSSRPASRSTTQPAASTRAKPAARRC